MLLVIQWVGHRLAWKYFTAVRAKRHLLCLVPTKYCTERVDEDSLWSICAWGHPYTSCMVRSEIALDPESLFLSPLHYSQPNCSSESYRPRRGRATSHLWDKGQLGRREESLTCTLANYRLYGYSYWHKTLLCCIWSSRPRRIRRRSAVRIPSGKS